MNFAIDRKTSFLALDGYVEIERNKKPFYSATNGGEPFYFNLPKGNYFIVDGDIEEIETFDFSFALPPKERDEKIPRLKVKFKPTKYKAHIFRHRGEIVIDPEFLKYPDYVQSFLKWHEVGHYNYKSEKGADLYAALKMLNLGYNPSQIYAAIETIFKDKPEIMRERIELIENTLSNENTQSTRKRS